MSVGKRLAEGCCNVGYDLLTIFISIADVTTDIIVLVDFYAKDRMVFFGISLTILIMAQCSYAMAFTARFHPMDGYGLCGACILFCILLPFGSFVAFCIYLSSEDTPISCFEDLMSSIFGDTEHLFRNNPNDSAFTRWIKNKLDKHIGFILEAGIEAFPQSLLQITAIVYFQEANYVSIISILISMFSVMTKSFILSQGAEKYTFVWTWLCMVTDFFGIFFMLTWVFYSHDLLQGIYLGYFNIFGFIWLCKITIAILFPIALGLIAFFGWFFWYFLFQEIDSGDCNCECCGISLAYIIFSPLLAVLCAFAAAIGFEVFCFAFCAVFVYMVSTQRIEGYHKDSVGKVVNGMLNFISNGSRKDRKLRVLAVNYGLNKTNNSVSKLVKYIQNTIDSEKEDKYTKLKSVTYQEIRENSGNPRKANLCRDMRMGFCSACREVSRCNNLKDCGWFLLFVTLMFILVPLFLLSKVLQILFPWIISGYLIYHNLLFSGEIDVFQLTMLGIEILLQIILLFLSIHIYRINYWLWHIHPASNSVYWVQLSATKIMQYSQEFYFKIKWLPEIHIILTKIYGNDIGNVIMDYLSNIDIDHELEQLSDVDYKNVAEIQRLSEITNHLWTDIENEFIELTKLNYKSDNDVDDEKTLLNETKDKKIDDSHITMLMDYCEGHITTMDRLLNGIKEDNMRSKMSNIINNDRELIRVYNERLRRLTAPRLLPIPGAPSASRIRPAYRGPTAPSHP